MSVLRYLHFGCQCPGDALEQGGREAAKILGMSFAVDDVRTQPELARTYRLFFPGMLVTGNLKLVFPGSGRQLADTIKAGGPLEGGSQEYRQLPEAEPDSVEVLGPHNLHVIRGMCIPTLEAAFWCRKEQWLKNFNLPCLGLAAFKDGRPVAVMETLPRAMVPYPVPDYAGLFVTCVYGRHDAEMDYRPGLLKGLSLLKEQGWSRLGIVAGRGTPFPNGPSEMLARAGFQEEEELDRVILRYRWADLVFMSRAF